MNCIEMYKSLLFKAIGLLGVILGCLLTANMVMAQISTISENSNHVFENESIATGYSIVIINDKNLENTSVVSGDNLYRPLISANIETKNMTLMK